MSVGDAWIDVTADGSGLPAQVRAMCERAEKWAKIEAEVDLETKGLIAEVKALAKTASEAATIEFDARLRAKELLAQAKALKEAAGGTVEYKAEFAKLTGTAGSLIRKANKQETIRVQAEVDFTEMDKQIASHLGREAFKIDIPAPVEVPADLDTDEVWMDYAKVKAAIQADPGIRLALQTDADQSSLRLAMDKLAAQVRANPVKIPTKAEFDAASAARVRAEAESVLGIKPVHIPVDLDFSALKARVGRGLTDLTVTGIDIPVHLDDGPVATEMAGIRAALANSPAVQVALEADPKLASARIAHAELAAAMKREGDIEIKVVADVDRFSFIAAQTFVKIRQASQNLGSGLAGIFSGLRDFGKSNKFLNAAVVTMRFAAAQAALVGLAIAAIIPSAISLAVALADIALQAAAAASALGVTLAGSLVAIGTAAVTTKIGLSGVGDAFTALGKIWAKTNIGAKASKKEIEAYNDALKSLAPSAREFVKAIDTIHPALRTLQQAVQQALFKGLGEQIRKTAKVDLPLLQTGFASVAKTLNGMATSTLKWLRSARGQDAINDIFRISNSLLKDLGSAAGNVGKGFLNLFSGSERSFGVVGGMIDDVARRFKNWTKDIVASGEWDLFLRDGEKALGDIGGLFAGAGTAIGKFWSALRTADGKNPLTSLSEAVQDWADGLTTDGIAAWVEQVRAHFEVVKKVVSKVWDGLTVGIDNLNKIAGFGDAVLEQIGLIEETGIDWEKVFTGKKGWEGEFGEMLTGSIKPNLARSLVSMFTSPLIADSISDGLQGAFANNQILRDIVGPDFADRISKALSDTIPDGIDIDGTTIRLREPELEFEPIDPSDLDNALEKAGLMRVVEGSMGNRAPNDTFTFAYTIQLEAKIKKDKKFQAKLEHAMREAGLNPPTPGSAGGFSPSTITMPIIVKPVPVFDWDEFNKRLTKELIDAGKDPVTPGSMGNYAPNIPVQPNLEVDEEELNRQLEEKLKRGLTGGGLGGKAGGTITVTPILGPVPEVDLKPIPWPVIPTLSGGLPSLPSLPDIPWPILPKFGPLPAYPVLTPGEWPIFSEWEPVPTPPQLVKRISRIISQWLPNPSPPSLPKRISRIISEWAKVPPPPKIDPIYVDIIPSFADAKGELIGAARGISVTRGPQVRLVGEAGPEAIVPLTRTQPLDASVRALLQAVAADRGMQPTAKGKDRVSPTINVNLPTGDPEAAAMAVFNRLVFEGAM